jgi:phage-related protein
MRSRLAPAERPLHWVASSKRDLIAMPAPVRREMGFALSVAQHGGRHVAAKLWKGEGPGVLEVVSDFDGNTFRSLYTVKFAKAVYVLHCFQKKSPSGIRTAKTDIDLVRERLKVARASYERQYGKAKV